MTSQEMVLDLLRWELERVLSLRDAVFQRAAILIGMVAVAGALLASSVPAKDTSPKEFASLGFWLFTAGLVLVGYATYLTLRCLWAKRTLLRELLGPQVLKGEVLTQSCVAQAQLVVIERLSLVVQHNQRDLIERRGLLNQGLGFMGVGVVLIGIALWYNSYMGVS